MEHTFWKTDPIPEKGIVVAHLLPMGSSKHVSEGILSIPHTHPFFCSWTSHGYVTVRWDIDGGVLLSFRDEQEFGNGGVFSLICAKQAVPDAMFFKLYVQLFEIFGALLLERDSFITVPQYKKRLTR